LSELSDADLFGEKHSWQLPTDGKIGQWLLVFIQGDELLRVVVLDLLD
jgi:hypothetical protein